MDIRAQLRSLLSVPFYDGNLTSQCYGNTHKLPTQLPVKRCQVSKYAKKIAIDVILHGKRQGNWRCGAASYNRLTGNRGGMSMQIRTLEVLHS